MRLGRTLVATLGIGALALGMLPAVAVPPAKEALPDLNQKVVAYARSQVGQRVGDGDCLTLAIVALDEAGATGYSLADPKGNYVWGAPVDSLNEALPGDVLQFRDAVFDGKKRVTKRRWISWHHEYPHHTAVVSAVQEGGKILVILHQNVGGPEITDEQKRIVQEATIRLDSLQPGGWVRAYRPSRKPPPARRVDDEAPPETAPEQPRPTQP